MKKTALVIGASGVLGSLIIKDLCKSESYTKVIAYARRELKFSHEKLEVKIIDFDKISELTPVIADEVFCALGTTIKQAKSKGQFYKVDVTYAVKFAKFGLECGAKRFVLVSSQGANAKSSSFYLKAKGKVEAKIAKLGYHSFIVVRPPIIDSQRSESRLGEELLIKAFKLIPKGIFENFRPMKAEEIAAAIVRVASKDDEGVSIYHPKDI